jgi:hypothetical protein
MDNFLELNIKDYLIVNISDLLTSKTIMSYKNVHDIIRSDMIEKLSSVVGTPINYCATFVTQPDFTLNIHSDNGAINGKNIWAINFVTNSHDHEMIWYSSSKPPTKHINKIGSFYYAYEAESLEVIQRSKIGSALVRTDIPHNVINIDRINPRICVSVRSTFSKLSWEDVYNRFLNSEFISV